MRNPANTTTTITPNGAVKCKRPIARPAPYTNVSRSGGRSLMALARWFRGGSLPRTATRRDRDLAEGFHDDHFDSRPALLPFQTDLRHYRPFPAGDVSRRNPVEREGQHIVAAELAATEGRKMGPQGFVGRENVILDQVLDHSTASDGWTTEPVNVEPVVPVRRTLT